MADDNYYTPVRNCLEVGRNQRFCAGAEEAARELAIKSATIKMLQAEVLERQSKLNQIYELLNSRSPEALPYEIAQIIRPEAPT